MGDAEVQAWPVPRLFLQYEWLAEARWLRTTEQVLAVQLGVGRALALAFGAKKLPDLPEYDDGVEDGKPHPHRLPAWMRRFEAANPHAIQTFDDR